MNTLVVGASSNPDRYSYKAVIQLLNYKYNVIPFGLKKGKIENISIFNIWDENWNIHTVTLYINKILQKDYYSKIIALKPKRIIFNPGTENEEFYLILKENNIYFEEACTLVLLNTGQY